MRSLKNFNFPLEERFILSILRGEEIKDLMKKINWVRFLNLIIQEDIYPFFYKFFENRRNLIPQKFFHILEILYAKNKNRVDSLKEETVYIFKKLKENNITPFLLRGFLLSRRIYGNIYSRAFSDIDIFLFRKDIDKAIEILGRGGFLISLEKKEEEFLKRFHFRFYNEYKLYKNGILIELHFDLLPHRFKYKGEIEKILEFEKYRFRDIEFSVLSKEWEIITLSIHSFLHRFSLLKFLFDIHSFNVKFKNVIDYEKIYWLCCRMGFLNIVKLSLSLSFYLFDTPFPSFLKYKILPDFLKKFIFNEKEPSFYLKHFLSLLFLSSLSHRMRYVLSLLTPEERLYKIIRLPEHLFFLYYPLRVFFILKNAISLKF